MIKPRGLNILVEADDKVKKIGSIYIPDDCQKRPQRGKVIAVGAGEYKRKTKLDDCWVKIMPELKVGDIVCYTVNPEFTRFGAIPVKINDKLYWIIDERDILYIEEETK